MGKLYTVIIIIILSTLYSSKVKSIEFDITKTIPEKHPIASNPTKDVFQDVTGRVWISEINGIRYIDGNDIVALSHPKLKEINAYKPRKIFELPDKTLLFSSYKGPIRYDPKTETFQFLKRDGDLPIHDYVILNDDVIGVTRSSLLKLKNNNHFNTVHSFGLSLKINEIATFKNEILLATTNGLLKYENNTVKSISTLSEDYKHIVINENNVYLFTFNKVLVINPSSFKPLKTLPLNSDKHNCEGTVVNHIIENNIIFFTTFEKYICALDTKTLKISNYNINTLENNSGKVSVNNINRDLSGGYLIATSQGVEYLSPTRKLTSLIKVQLPEIHSHELVNGKFVLYTYGGLYESLDLVSFNKISDESADIVINISDTHTLFMKEFSPRKISIFNKKEMLVENHDLPVNAEVILDYRDNKVYFIDSTNVYSLDVNTNSLNRFSSRFSHIDRFFQFATDQRSSWFAGCTFRGDVYIVGDIIRKFQIPKNSLNQKENCYSITSFNKEIFFNTPRSLFRLDFDNNEPIKIREFASDTYRIRIFKNNIYTAHNNEVYVYDLNSNNYKPIIFDSSNIRAKSYFSDFNLLPDGSVTYGMPSHILHINKKLLETPVVNQFIHITSFLQDNIEQPINRVSGFTELDSLSQIDAEIPYENDVIQFTLTNPNYYNDVDIQYRYRLVGYKDEWQYGSKEQPYVTYINLPPNDYLFEAQASFNGGDWVGSSKLKFTIETPYWMTWWAYSLYLLLLALIIYFAMWLRTVRLRKRTQQLEQTVAERTQQIVEQKATIEQLLERKNQMFANISHELRTPLTLIIGPIKHFLKDGEKDNPNTLLKSVLSNAVRLKTLVDQSLEIARFDANKSFETICVNLSAFTQTMVESFSTLAVTRKIKLESNIQQNVLISANKEMTETLLSNLLSNALKYTPEGGTVLITLTSLGDQAKLSVEDSGDGIPEDQREQIFERFARLEAHTEQAGTGLGLALVKELVESLEGTVSISDSQFGGANFTVLLPVFKGKLTSEPLTPGHIELDFPQDALFKNESIGESDIASLSPEPGLSNDSVKPRVLIVEDNAQLRQFLHKILSPFYQCITANDGEQGLEVAINHMPDLIISDLMMPRKSGLELAAALRDNIHTSHIPIILLTAKSDDETRMQAWRTDVDEFLAKPFDEQELLLRCQNLLHIRQLLNQRIQANMGQRPIAGLSAKDQEFLTRLEQVVSAHYSSADTQVQHLAKAMHMSESQLQRKTRALLDQGVNEYLRNYRLKQAAELLLAGKSASSAALEVGFSSSSYFSSCFKAFFGVTPSQYRSQNSATKK